MNYSLFLSLIRQRRVKHCLNMHLEMHTYVQITTFCVIFSTVVVMIDNMGELVDSDDGNGWKVASKIVAISVDETVGWRDLSAPVEITFENKLSSSENVSFHYNKVGV